MTEFDKDKLTETVLYILEKTGGVDFYHIFKILYFAEMKHLAKWGNGIVADEYRALKYGPVPTHLYDAVKELNHPKLELSEKLSESVMFAGEDAPNVLLPRRNVDIDYFSESEMEALDQSIEENKSLTFGQLMRKSHDSAWSEAHKKLNGNNVISPVAMAKVLDADDSIIDYIENQMLIDAAIS